MKIYVTLLIIFAIIIVAILFFLRHSESVSASQKSLIWFKNELNVFAAEATRLEHAFNHISQNDSASVDEAKNAFKKCRMQYKRISFFMEYFFPEEAKICNGPPVQEAENQQIEFKEPLGLQVIESLLYKSNFALYKEDLIKQANMLARTATSFSPLLSDFKTKDVELLESLHLELIRIITLYITGYDAPEIKSGIEEAHESLSTIEINLAPLIKGYEQEDSIEYYFTKGKQYLATHLDFDSFDRLLFITNYALPLERDLNKFINEKGYSLKTFSALNIHSKDLFSPEALDKKAFPHTEDETDSLVANLGKQLFFETALSGNSTRSCGSCHSPTAFFSDRLSRNKTMDGTADLLRNTPGLFYSSYQYAQFWDGRVRTLEDQIHTVLRSKTEMNSSDDTIITRLKNNPAYSSAFKKIWTKNPEINFEHAAGALAAYIRTLTPFKSPFDRYMRGDKSALSAPQQRGFNLFMGKAKCGSCHFAPLFNGLLPPNYNTTEYEVLGTPSDDNLESPHSDSDQGRYTFMALSLFKGAFKTPTVRNAAMTAPYMHNGKFSTLEKVIDFYDRGGGAGLGLDVPGQTLSSSPLHLTKQEKAEIIAFIESLTDNDK
jgi:cytochrome c peroxidase